MDENRYWIAQGRSLEILRTWTEATEAYYASMRALAEELTGTAGFYRSGEEVVGFVAVEGRETPGLRRQGKMLVPNRKTKAGRDVADRMKLPKACDPDVARSLLWGSSSIILAPAERKMYQGGWREMEDGTVVLMHCASVKVDPPDAEPIPKSRYYAMVEAAQP
jgi:hypothetical protein